MTRLPLLLALVIAAPLAAQDKADSHEAIVQDYLKAINEANALLKGVTDEASEKAKHAGLEKSLKTMTDIKGRMDKMGPPSPELNAKLKTEYKPKFEAALGTFKNEILRVTQKPYGASVTALMAKYGFGPKEEK